MTATKNSVRDGQYIKLSDGRKLGFAEYGHLRGKPILYFHGGISCRLDIGFAAQALQERGLRVIALDRPGIGLSDPKPERTLLDWADDVEEFMTEMELCEIPLLGWSLGSAYVLPCAFALGDMFSKIATVGTCASFDSPEYVSELGLFMDRFLINCPESFRWMARWILLAFSKAPPGMLKRLAVSEVSKSAPDLEILRLLPTEEITDFLLGSMYQGPDGVIDDYWAVRESWGFSPSEIGIDMIMYQGEEDLLAPMSGAVRMSELIPGARLITVPRAGHFLLHTNLDVVLDSLVK